MRRRITPHSSRVAELDEQLPRYGLRKRTTHQTALDGKSLEDPSKHQNLPKRPKRTPNFTRAQSSSSRGSAKRKTRKQSGQGWTQKHKDKVWFAEAILEESDTQYLIKYEPVYEGAQCEISWQPKHYANAALIAWWEEHKMGSALENGTAECDNVPDLSSEDNKASQHYTSVEHGGRPQEPVTGLLPLEQYDAKSEAFQQNTVDLVDKRMSDGNEEPLEDALLKATSTVVTEISNVPMPEINVAVSQMYDHHRPRELRDSSPVAPNSPGGVSASPRFKISAILPTTVEDNHRCDKSQTRNVMASEGGSSKSQPKLPKAALSTGQHIEMSASSQQLRMNSGEHPVYAPVADDTKELESYLVEAATAYVSQNRNDHTFAQAAYGMQINDYKLAEGSEQVSKGHVTDWGGQGRPSPRPGTSISTILSPVPSTLSNNNKDNGSATYTRNHSSQALPRTLVHVEAFNNKDPGIPGAPLGKLANAREQLRLLLHGPGRRAYRKSRSLFLPSP
jgi:hypothetical protein